MGGQVHRRTVDRVAILEIDNPPVNVLSQDVRRALADALMRADSESEIGAIVIAARGATFVTGADMSEFGQKPREPHLPDVIDRLEASSKPIVVAWNGLALGGGCEIGLAAHRRIIGRNAKVGLPEVKVGLIPGAGGTQRLPRLIGLPAALDMIASGRFVDAMEAFALGLCDEVTDGDVLEAAIIAARGMIGKMQPRLSLRAPSPPDAAAWETMVAKVRREARGRIAPLRAIELVGQTLSTPYAIGAPTERRAYLDLMASDQSRALRHLFFAERAVRTMPELEGIAARPLGSIGIVGGGSTGAGIAATLLEHGFQVVLVESGDAALQAGRERVAGLMARAIRAGRIADRERAEIARRITFSTDLHALGRASLVIEAIFEDIALKADLFAKLEGLLPSDTLIATNTSYLDIEAMAAGLARPERFLGLHFFAPAPVIRLIEVVRARRTAASVIATALDLARRLDKIAVVCAPCEGLIGNRILAKFRAECEFMLEEGALPAEIDRALEAFGLAMGPFAAQDLAGLDIAWSRRKRQADTRNPGERDVPLVDRLCEMGRFGQKAGRGWYLYRDGRREVDPEVEALIRAHAAASGRRRMALTPDVIQTRVLAAMVNEGAKILMDGVAARPREIDLVLVHGYGFPAFRGGPMQEADARGIRAILAAAEGNAARDGAGFEVAPLLLELLASGRNFASLNQPETFRPLREPVPAVK